ncbi:MAG TPA: biotin synthase BioB [Spirochaetota bacterium]|nr:biotin synthase BioB [Spirochaetota bacterium]HOL57494.1 biotin synthase BioB [Spirochaetota bacterium]HPP04425.1 biotin synthase BioB [Spirochaetota bacterium]
MIRKELKFDNIEQILEFTKHFSTGEIIEYAQFLRKKYFSNKIELCSISNIKSGLCPEDCKYCAQSSFYNTNIMEYDLQPVEKILPLAEEMKNKNVKSFSLVTSGRTPDDKDFEKIIEIIKIIKSKVDISICVSIGFLSKERVKKLKEAGVTKCHHNLETGPNFFEKICTTHTYKDKLETIKNIKEIGLEVCSGGIFGLGESLKDRIEMAFELKKLGVKSIPINILRTIKGTPLENIPRINEDELLLSIALVRIINPDATIRIAGGRPFFKEKENEKLIGAGINAFMVGNYLTTTGIPIEEDLSFFKNNGYLIIK